MRSTPALFTVLVLSIAALAWGSNPASNEKRSITAVAQNYMDAYYTADANRMQKALHPDFHWHDFALECPAVRGCRRALVTLKRECIQLVTFHAVLVGDHLRARELAEVLDGEAGPDSARE